MGWRWQQTRAQDASLSSRLDERKFAVEGDLALDAQPPVKIEQIDAASQQDVLAIVDRLFAKLVGSCASAQKRPRLEDLHRVPRSAQRRRRRQTGQPAAEHDHIGHRSAFGVL